MLNYKNTLHPTLLFLLFTFMLNSKSFANKYDNGFPEEKYHSILDQFIESFTPSISAKGGSFEIWRDWSDGAVNMWAEKWGDRYILEVPGGMARYHLINEEAFILSICHELGHLLGGAPKNGDISFEGQSDYFAGRSCIKQMLSLIAPLKSIEIDQDVFTLCSGNSLIDENLCQRSLQGAKSLTSYYAEIAGKPFPQLDQKSKQTPKETLTSHPTPQCRLDTFKNAILGSERPSCWYVKP